jgi:hypothetical protein
MNRRGFVLALCVALLACSSTGPAPEKVTHAKALEQEFPPTGPVSLAAQAPPADGVLYQLLMKYEGRNEVTLKGQYSYEDPQNTGELVQLELDYRELPVAAPSETELATSLVLDALRRRAQISPPGTLIHLEAGDDRLRTSKGEKVDIDLRGAQPKGDMTPRSVLNKAFALLVTDRNGNATGVTLRGIPSVKKMLASMPLREVLGYMQVARPDGPVLAGATWSAKRYLASPVGRLGVAANVEYRLVGFEKIDEVPCARVSIRAQRDEPNAKSELGFPLEQVRIELGGDAWIELGTGLVRLLRIEDIAAVAYERKGAGSMEAKMRTRYETRASLQQLDVKTTTAKWADGTKRFAEVKTAPSAFPHGGGPQGGGGPQY